MGKPSRRLTPSNLGSAPRIERKVIEKNRRNKMKNLYSHLTSLLPHNTSNSKVEETPLPDQIDEAIEHITNMKTRLEKLRQKKADLLLRRNKPNNSCINNDQNQATSEIFEVHEMGPNINIILAKGLRDYSSFRRIITFAHQNGAEIASASFARDGNSSIQVLHDKVGIEAKQGFDGETISRKVKELVCGGGASLVESRVSLWDYDIDSDINCGFEIPQVLLPGLEEFIINMNKL